MPEVEQLVAADGPVAVPYEYDVPPKAALQPSVVNATFDGTAAAGDFLPCCSIYSQDGRLISRTFPGTVAAGDVAEVTYGPFLKAPVDVGLAATPPAGSGFTRWVVGGYQGLIKFEGSLVGYWRLGHTGTNTELTESSGVAPEEDLAKTVGSTPGSSYVVGFPNDPADGAYQTNAFNPAAGLDANGDLFLSGGTPRLNVNNVSAVPLPFSVECWINPAAGDIQYAVANGCQFAPIAAQFNPDATAFHGDGFSTPGGQGWIMYLELINTRYYWVTFLRGGDAARSGFALQAGTWYHVVGTYDGANVRLYINGVAVSFAADNSGGAAPGALSLARVAIAQQTVPFVTDSHAYRRGFHGVIDEVALYNKALSQAEILLHYSVTGPASQQGKWVTTAALAGSLLDDQSVTAQQLADGSVTTQKLVAQAVTAAKIATGTITATQVAAANKDGVAATASMRTIGAGAQQAMGGNDARLVVKIAAPYSASITLGATQGTWQTITVTNAVAFTIVAPTTAPTAANSWELTIEIVNGTAGAIGALTWNAVFVLLGGAWVQPLAGKKRYITFKWNGTNWIEQARAASDY